jgi:hypothetical protein
LIHRKCGRRPARSGRFAPAENVSTASIFPDLHATQPKSARFPDAVDNPKNRHLREFAAAMLGNAAQGDDGAQGAAVDGFTQGDARPHLRLRRF